MLKFSIAKAAFVSPQNFVALALLVFVLLAPHQSLASTTVGNGGHVVVCQELAGKQIVPLDIAEAKAQNSKWRYELGPAFYDVRSKVEIAIERLEKFSPKRGAHYRNQIENSFEVLTSATLPKIDDTGALRLKLKPECSLDLAAFQLIEPFSQGQRKIVFSREYYQQMSNNDLAALYLHELVYAEGAALGLTSSSSVRPLVALLAGHELETMSFESFVAQLSAAKLRDFEYFGLNLRLYDDTGTPTPPLFLNGNLKRALSHPGEVLQTSAGPIAISGEVEFYDVGQVSSFHTWDWVEIRTKSGTVLSIKPGSKLKLSPTGEILD